MPCEAEEWVENAAFLRRFRERAAQERTPLSGTLEITHRCNLHCVHCYLGPHGETAPEAKKKEMGTTRWLSVIDEITTAGCLNLLITGGEPFLRPDFADIYRHAKQKGLLVAVFTNGTRVTAPLVDLFRELPPRSVEITLYGATEATYERITGVRGSYAACMDGIHRLRDAGIRVGLKTILMTLNRHEFRDIESFAASLNVKFRFDAAIFPRADGGRGPLNLRVSPREAVDLEMENPKRREDWQKFFERHRDPEVSDRLFLCGAGVTGFSIDPFGGLKPCLMAGAGCYDLTEGTFLTGWKEAIPAIRNIRIRPESPCRACDTKTFCGYCPYFFELETGTPDLPSDYLCAMGRIRLETLAPRL